MPKPKKTPPTARPGKPPQTIRGGFIVVRRDDRTGRLLTMHGTAYEHGSAAAARVQATILAERFGCEFAVFCEVDAVVAPAQPATVVDTVVDMAVDTRARDTAPSADSGQAPASDRRCGTLTLRRSASPA